MLLQMAVCVSPELSFPCVCPLQSFSDGRNVFISKPVFGYCMYGCTCARSFIQSAWSILCHIKSKCLFVSLCFWPIFLDSALLHCCYLDIRAVLMIVLLMHQSISWVQVLPHFSFSILSSVISWLPTTSSNILYVMVMLQSTGTLCVISDGILLHGYISMGGHIIPEAWKVNMAVMVAFARTLSTSYSFLSSLHAKTFPISGKN